MGRWMDADLLFGYAFELETEDKDWNITHHSPEWMREYDDEDSDNFAIYTWNHSKEWIKRTDKPMPEIDFHYWGHTDDSERKTFVVFYIIESRINSQDMEEIDPDSLVIKESWINDLKLFAEILEMPMNSDPKWILTASYG